MALQVDFQTGSPPSAGIPGEAGARAWSHGFVEGWYGEDLGPEPLHSVRDQGRLAGWALARAVDQGRVSFRMGEDGELKICGHRADRWYDGLVRGILGQKRPQRGGPGRAGWLLGHNFSAHVQSGNLHAVVYG